MSNLKETVKENYNICDYVNNHIIPNRAYRGSNRRHFIIMRTKIGSSVLVAVYREM